MRSVGVYHSEKYTAYFYEKSIVISTNKQSIRISADRYNSHYLDMLILNIIRGRVNRLDELRDYDGALIYSSCSRPTP